MVASSTPKGVQATSHRTAARKPGPGSHEIPSFPEAWPTSTTSCSASFTVGTRLDLDKTDLHQDRRGPGVYSPKKEFTEEAGPAHSFPGSPRLVDCATATSRRHGTFTGRGPGFDLAQQDNHMYPVAPSHGVSKEQRFFRAPGGLWEDLPGRGCVMPGPGSHWPDDSRLSTNKQVTTYSMAKKRAASTPRPVPTNKLPGPGDYTLRTEDLARAPQASPRCVFGSARRCVEAQSTAMASKGSGSVANNGKSMDGGGSHGTARRKTPPGPGRYNTSNVTRNGAHSLGGGGHSFGGRRPFSFGVPEERSWDPP